MHKFILVLLLSTSSFLLNAQSTSGGLIYTLGKDTTMMGNYYLEKNDFFVHMASRVPSLNVQKMRGRFFPNGEIEFAEGFNYKPVDGKEPEVISSYKLFNKGDSVYIEVKRGEVVTNQQYKARTMLSNSVGGASIVFMLPLMINYAPERTGDSLLSTHIVLNTTKRFIVKRVSDKRLIIGSTVMGFFKINLDKKGALDNVDAIGTSWNIKGRAVRPLNMDSVITINLAREKSSKPPGAISPLDSIQTLVNGVNVKIKYTRPSVRGRVIFGEVVPWNRFWRTGANAATKFSIDKTIYMDGKELPAGDYSIWTMPSQSGWKMMFNKEANIWGTEYNPEKDLLTVPVQTIALPDNIELFTFRIEPEGNNGRIIFEWEKLRAVVKFTTSK